MKSAKVESIKVANRELDHKRLLFGRCAKIPIYGPRDPQDPCKICERGGNKSKYLASPAPPLSFDLA